jgi:hypothetical protein
MNTGTIMLIVLFAILVGCIVYKIINDKRQSNMFDSDLDLINKYSTTQQDPEKDEDKNKPTCAVVGSEIDYSTFQDDGINRTYEHPWDYGTDTLEQEYQEELNLPTPLEDTDLFPDWSSDPNLLVGY